MRLYVDFISSLPTAKQKFHGGGNYAKQIVLALINYFSNSLSITLLCPIDFIAEREIDRKIINAPNVSLLPVKEFSESIEFEKDSTLFLPILSDYKYFAAVNRIKVQRPDLKIYATIHDIRILEYYYDSVEKYYFKGIVRFLFGVLQPLQEGLVPLLHKNEIRRCLGNLDKVFTDSNYSLQKILSIYKATRITYYYQPPFLEKVSKNEMPPQESFILFVSGGRRLKNLVHALGAFSAFKEHNQANSDYLYITGITKEQFLNLCDYPKVNKEVILKWVKTFDYLSEDELDSLYFSCKFLLYTSKREGFGLPVLEAAIHGKTAIASNITSIPEVLGNAVYYVNPWDDRDIERGLSYFTEPERLSEYEERVKQILPLLQERSKLDMNFFIQEIVMP